MITEEQHCEIQTLGMMRAAHEAAQKAVPKDPEIRLKWLEVLRQMNKCVLEQWSATDSALSQSESRGAK